MQIGIMKVGNKIRLIDGMGKLYGKIELLSIYNDFIGVGITLYSKHLILEENELAGGAGRHGPDENQ